MDSRPGGASPSEEELLSIDRTYAILAAMWDKRNEYERTLDPKAFKEKEDAIGYSLLLNLRNTTEPGFHRLVNRETDYLNEKLPKGNVVREHQIVLTKFVLVDNLKLATNEYGALDDLERPRKRGRASSRNSKYEGGVPGPKHLKRFVEMYYPEMITYPLRLARKPPQDGRFQPFETTITKQETEEHLKKVQEMIKYYTPDFLLEVWEGLGLAGESAMMLKTYDPDDLAKLTAYRGDVERALNELPPGPSHWMIEQFRTYRYTVKPMFEELRWYVELKWFQRLPRERQKELVKTKARFEYSRDDARRAIDISSKWYADDAFVFRQVLPVSWAFARVKMPEVGEYLYRECQSQLKLPKVERILCLENIAHSARWQGRTDEAIAGLEDALQRWKKIGPEQIASLILDHSWLSGLYLSKGNPEAANKHRNSLVRLLPDFKAKASPAYQAHIFLQTADTAMEHKDRDLENRLLNEGLEASMKDDNLYQYSLYFQQSLDDLARYGSRQWGYHPSRFPHPDSREWRTVTFGNSFREFRV